MNKKILWLGLFFIVSGCDAAATSSVTGSSSAVSSSSGSTSSAIGSSVSSDSETSSSVSSDEDQPDFEEALNHTRVNYSFVCYDSQTDDLTPSQSHIAYRAVFYDEAQSRMQTEHLTVFTTDRSVFDAAKANEENYYRTVYYRDEDAVQCRYKNPGADWEQMQYSSSYQSVMDTKMLDYIDPSHFEQKEDGFFYLKSEYLLTEEASRLAGYYGSFAYLVQDYQYIAFSVRDNRLDQYKMEVHFTHREGNSFAYDAYNTVTGQFTEVGTTSIDIPSLPVFAEDLLEADPTFEQAKTNAEKNYTYDETVSIVDQNGNEVVREYQEQVMADAFHYYNYLDSIDCYYDDYIYKVYKESFSGGAYATSYETLLIYYDDYTDYQTYDMDILDDSISKLENVGGSYGSKIYEYVEDGNYYTPRQGKPERYNPKDYTYLDVASLAFIHGLYGNYTAGDGTTYQYQFNDLKIYLNEQKEMYRVTYDYNLQITKGGAISEYHYVGNGSFSNIGTTSFAIPSDPNEDIVMDERLEGVYQNINPSNYTYEETYSIVADDGSKKNFSLEEGVVSETSYLKEMVDGSYVYNEYPVNAVTAYDDDGQPEYHYCSLKDYYYFGEEKCLNYFEVGDSYSNRQLVTGSYQYSGIAEKYKEYLKFFKYSSTRTINGQEVMVFRLTSSYLKLYGKELIATIGSNQTASVTSLILQISNDQIYSISYTYDYYDTSNTYIGECEGTIALSDFGTTEVSNENIDESLCDNTDFEDIVAYLSEHDHTVLNAATASYFKNGYSVSGIYASYGASKIVSAVEDTFYYDENGNLYLKVMIDDQEYHLEIVPFDDFDLSVLRREDFYVDSNGYYILNSDKMEEYFAAIFRFEGEAELKPVQFYLEIQNNTLNLYYSYHMRYRIDEDTYAVIYVSGQIALTTNLIYF